MLIFQEGVWSRGQMWNTLCILILYHLTCGPAASLKIQYTPRNHLCSRMQTRTWYVLLNFSVVTCHHCQQWLESNGGYLKIWDSELCGTNHFVLYTNDSISLMYLEGGEGGD